MGHEIYYWENPAEFRRALRKARRRGISGEVQRIADYYRTFPDKPANIPARKEKKRRIRVVVFYIGTVLTAIVGVVLIYLAFPFREDIFEQKIKTADYTSIFLLLCGILTVIAAVGMFRRKLIDGVRYTAAGLMVMSIWSAGISFSIQKRATIADCIISAVCFVIYLFGAFAAPSIAGDIRTAEQLGHDRKELKINLYEIGFMEERELRFALGPQEGNFEDEYRLRDFV